MKSIARWESIARDLDEQITSGQLAPGARLPSEDNLSKTYGVSRMTMRQALRSLEENGLITRIQGSGTYVPDELPVHRRGNMLGSFHEELGLPAAQVTTKVVLAEVVAPPAHIAKRLGLTRAQQATQFDRIRIVNRRAISYQQAWVPFLTDPGLVRAELPGGSIYRALLERDRIEISRASQEVTAAAATEQLAEVLSCPVGSPLIDVRRISYTPAGTAVVAAQSWTLPKYSLTYDLGS